MPIPEPQFQIRDWVARGRAIASLEDALDYLRSEFNASIEESEPGRWCIAFGDQPVLWCSSEAFAQGALIGITLLALHGEPRS